LDFSSSIIDQACVKFLLTANNDAFANTFYRFFRFRISRAHHPHVMMVSQTNAEALTMTPFHGDILCITPKMTKGRIATIQAFPAAVTKCLYDCCGKAVDGYGSV
jgi:hypothetical protein